MICKWLPFINDSFIGEIRPGESTVISSFLGHVFSAHSADPSAYSDDVSPLDVAKMPMRKNQDGEQEPMAEEAFRNIVDFMVRIFLFFLPVSFSSYDFIATYCAMHNAQAFVGDVEWH